MGDRPITDRYLQFNRKDEKTGDVILSRRPESWEEFFRFRDKAIEADRRAVEEFLAERKDEVPERREVKRLRNCRKCEKEI